jgi:hypothetical protein
VLSGSCSCSTLGDRVILLLGGDKSGAWEAWYLKAVPEADELYDTYLNELRTEGLI